MYCRICFDNDKSIHNPLLEPCLCNGTSKYIHKKCLENWINTNNIQSINRLQCNICKFKYNINTYKKYKYLYFYTFQSLINYLGLILIIYMISLVLTIYLNIFQSKKTWFQSHQIISINISPFITIINLIFYFILYILNLLILTFYMEFHLTYIRKIIYIHIGCVLSIVILYYFSIIGFISSIFVLYYILLDNFYKCLENIDIDEIYIKDLPSK